MGRVKDYYYWLLEQMPFTNNDDADTDIESVHFEHQDNEDIETMNNKKKSVRACDKQSSSTKP